MFANTFARCPIPCDASQLSAAVHVAWKSARERLSILVMAQLETLVETGPCADRNIARVRIWLYAVAALVFLMVSIGGATRLTGSGLSITEWQPIMGAVPPLTEADWQQAFGKYREIPQYQHVNRGMSLEAFKFIYWWEWTHRFLGRLIGVVFLVPFLYFLATGQIPRAMSGRLAGIFALGALQGALGWYMVSSGPRHAHRRQPVSACAASGACDPDLGRAAVGGVVAGPDHGAARRRLVAASAHSRSDPCIDVPADTARRPCGGTSGGCRLQYVAPHGRAADPRRPRRHAALVSEPVRERACRAVQSPHGRVCAHGRSRLARVEAAGGGGWSHVRQGACGRRGRAGGARHMDPAGAGAAGAGPAHQAGAAAVFGVAVWHLHVLRQPRMRHVS